MPLVRIETRKGLDDAQKHLLLDAVHEALVAAFEILDGDRNQRLLEYDPADFEAVGKGERFTIVTIDAFAGRSVDAKRRLFREIATRFADIGVPAADVVVVIHDVPSECWGIRGGQAACDVDLGYDVNL